MNEYIKILFVGDIIGKPGRTVIKELLPKVVSRHTPDMVIANGENAAGGFGITVSIYNELLRSGIDAITTGNHVWDRKEIIDLFKGKADSIVRPANYPDGTPGPGWMIKETPSGIKVGILNLQGRVFMQNIDCPFIAARTAIAEIKKITPIIFIDMHAETTSEKAAIGWYLDSTASAVLGTHTHVQTSDERILPGGTAFLTDAGMTGPVDSVIGMQRELVLERFLTGMPNRFEVASKGLQLQGVVVTVDTATGKATKIERIREVMN